MPGRFQGRLFATKFIFSCWNSLFDGIKAKKQKTSFYMYVILRIALCESTEARRTRFSLYESKTLKVLLFMLYVFQAHVYIYMRIRRHERHRTYISRLFTLAVNLNYSSTA